MKRCISVLVLAVFATATTCFADSITMETVSFPGGTVLAGSGGLSIHGDVYNEAPYQYTFGNDGTGSAAALDGQTINGFWISFTQEISQHPDLPAVFNLEGLNAALPNTYQQIESLMYYAQVGRTTSGGYTGSVSFSQSGPSVGPATAGLGIAIWAVLQESSSNGSAPAGGYVLSSTAAFNAAPNGPAYPGAYFGADVDYAAALLQDLNTNGNTSNSVGTVDALVDATNGAVQPQGIILLGVPEPCGCVGLAGR